MRQAIKRLSKFLMVAGHSDDFLVRHACNLIPTIWDKSFTDYGKEVYNPDRFLNGWTKDLETVVPRWLPHYVQILKCNGMPESGRLNVALEELTKRLLALATGRDRESAREAMAVLIGGVFVRWIGNANNAVRNNLELIASASLRMLCTEKGEILPLKKTTEFLSNYVHSLQNNREKEVLVELGQGQFKSIYSELVATEDEIRRNWPQKLGDLRAVEENLVPILRQYPKRERNKKPQGIGVKIYSQNGVPLSVAESGLIDVSSDGRGLLVECEGYTKGTVTTIPKQGNRRGSSEERTAILYQGKKKVCELSDCTLKCYYEKNGDDCRKSRRIYKARVQRCWFDRKRERVCLALKCHQAPAVIKDELSSFPEVLPDEMLKTRPSDSVNNDQERETAIPLPGKGGARRMNEDSDFRKRLLKHLAKGGVKAIPVAGGILEELVFGVLEENEWSRELGTLTDALDEIKNRSTAEQRTLDQVLDEVSKVKEISTKLKESVDQVRIYVRDPNEANQATNIKEVLDTFLADLEERSRNLRKEGASEEEGITRAIAEREDEGSSLTCATESDGEEFTRIEVLIGLLKISHDDLENLTASFGGFDTIAPIGANQASLARTFVKWSCSSSGPGLREVVACADKLGIKL